MAIMNEKQTELLTQLEAARVSYDSFEDELAYEIADRKWSARTETRRLVREAREAGVPYRQIGIALQTSDHKTIKDYEKDVRR